MKDNDILNSFVNFREPRCLPVIVAVDRSGSMCGERIDAINYALRNFVEYLQHKSNPEVEIQVALYSFGSDVTCDIPLTSIKNITRTPVYEAMGHTAMGMAFKEMKKLTDDLEYISPRVYNPIIVVVTDGSPTDDHYSPLKNLVRDGRSAKADRMAMAIGDSADRNILSEFVSKPEYLIYGNEGGDIINFFEYVTMAIASRMAKHTPVEIDRLAWRFLGRDYKNNGRCLIASLYALRERANTEVVTVLEKVTDIKDLYRYYKQDEIELLLDYFPYIFRKYYSYDKCPLPFSIEPSDIDDLIFTLLEDYLQDNKSSNTLIPYRGFNYILQGNVAKGESVDLILSASDELFLMIAEEILGDVHVNGISSDNYLDSCIAKGKEYTNIIAMPEFSLSPGKSYGNEGLLQEEIIDMLNSLLSADGRMFLLLQEEVCHSKSWRRFRQFLSTNSNKYEITIINLPIDYMQKEVDTCLFIIKKCRYPGFNKPLNLANLNLPKFKTLNHYGSCSLNISEIVKNIKSLDPQYFIRKAWPELSEGFDLSPLHYEISDAYRLETLIRNYLVSKISFDNGNLTSDERNAKKLIASLYALTYNVRQRYLEAISPIVKNLDGVMSKDNQAFLVERFNEVVEYCFRRETRLSDGIVFNKIYLSLIASLLEEVELPEVPITFLPFGNIQFSPIYPDTPFHCIEASKIDEGIGQIINTTLKLGGEVFDQERYYKSYERPHRYYGRIIAVPNVNKEDIRLIIDKICKCVEDKLGYGGKMAILLPREACYEPKWERLRKFLTQDCKEITLSVISLAVPSSTTFEETSLFIVEKHLSAESKPSFGKVRLVDAANMDYVLQDEIVGPYDIKVEDIIDAIKTQNPKSVRLVPINNLDEGYNLLAARYFRFDCFSENERLTKNITCLKDVVTLIPRFSYERVNANSFLSSEHHIEQVISIQALTDNYLDCEIDIRKLKDNSSKTTSYTSATGGYIAYSNGRILVGKIRNADETIIGIEENICHFQVDPTRASLDYILKNLSTQAYVLEQVKCLTKGYIWTDGYLHPEDLLQICIELPSIKIQQNEILADSQKGYTEKVIELENAFNEFKEDMHNKKHGIGQTIFAINNWMRLLKIARKRGHGVVNDNDIIGKNHPQSVSQIYENLEATMKRLQVQISKMDTGYEMVPTEIGITGFIEDFICNHPRAEFEYINLVNWRAEKDLPVVDMDESGNTHISKTDYILQKGDELYFINFPVEAFEIILENIISNACSHGFIDNEAQYKIKISGEISGKNLSIFVSNNGAPIHNDFSEKDVFKYAKSTSDALSGHHGTGGYEVWKLMKEFGGTSEFISRPEEEYTVIYKLTFPISNMVNINL